MRASTITNGGAARQHFRFVLWALSVPIEEGETPMGTFALRISVGIAALILASGAAAQDDPQEGRRMIVQFPQSRILRINWTDVPLHDPSGNVVATMSYSNGRDGTRMIRFLDADGNLINMLGGKSSMAPSSSGGGSNPLRGDPLPALVEVQPPNNNYRSYGASELGYLKEQVEYLKRQARLLTDRINDAAAR